MEAFINNWTYSYSNKHFGQSDSFLYNPLQCYSIMRIITIATAACGTYGASEKQSIFFLSFFLFLPLEKELHTLVFNTKWCLTVFIKGEKRFTNEEPFLPLLRSTDNQFFIYCHPLISHFLTLWMFTFLQNTDNRSLGNQVPWLHFPVLVLSGHSNRQTTQSEGCFSCSEHTGNILLLTLSCKTEHCRICFTCSSTDSSTTQE